MERMDPASYGRLIEAAELRARRLRREAVEAFWAAVADAVARALRAGRERLERLFTSTDPAPPRSC